MGKSSSRSNTEHRFVDMLFATEYDHLQQIASTLLKRCKDQTLFHSGDLVHEAYLKLIKDSRCTLKNRNHFICTASRTMQHVLIDSKRRQYAQKRGGCNMAISFECLSKAVGGENDECVAVHQAIDHLHELDERVYNVVLLRFFVGLNINETASVLELSAATVKRDWHCAKDWLAREIENSYI